MSTNVSVVGVSELREPNPLRRRFHCTCDLPPLCERYTLQFTIVVLVVSIVLYSALWFSNALLSPAEITVWPSVLGPIQRSLSDSRLLDPIALALGLGVAFYSLLLSALMAVWDWSEDRWRSLRNLPLGLTGFTIGVGFALYVVYYGALFSLVVWVPILSLVCASVIAGTFALAWACEHLKSFRKRR